MERIKGSTKGVRHFFWKWFLKPILYCSLGLIALSTVAAAVLLSILYSKGFFALPDFSRLNDPRQASQMYDRAGEHLDSYCEYCRQILPTEAMGDFPKYAVQVEDHRYWNITRRWSPFDFIGIGHAIVTNLIHMQVKRGASGITQQVTRNGLLEAELNEQWTTNSDAAKWWRKGREAWIAPIVQNTYSREEILKLYLNSNYCGYRMYGISLCSWYWYDKKPHELNPAEKAWILLLWRTPTYAEIRNPDAARTARSRVLGQFVERNLITEEERQMWEKYPLPNPRSAHTKNVAPHFTEWLRRDITAKGKLADMGMTYRTTLDAKLQRLAAQAIQKQLAVMLERNPELTDLRACAIVIHRSSGAILVWAEDPSFKENQFLLCSQANPQTGSAMKPLFYALWLRKGGRLSCLDEGNGPCRLDDSSGIAIPMGDGDMHQIHNFPYQGLPRYIGIAEPLRCITESRNACTMSGVEKTWYSSAERFIVPDPEHEGKVKKVRISKEEMLAFALELGIELETYKGDLEEARKLGMLVDPKLADKLGISHATVDPGLTLPIGSINVSPLEMAVMFATLTTGQLVKPYGIEVIQDPAGNSMEPDRPLPKMVFYKKEKGEVVVSGKTIEIEVEVPDEKLILGITRGLRATIELPHGTGQLARNGKWDEKNQKWIVPKLDFQVCGKTGTATRSVKDPITGEKKSQTTDNWFIGCTPSYVAAVWIGRDKKLPLMKPEWEGKTTGQFTGGSTALPIFIEIMKALYETEPKESFPEATNPSRPFFYPAPAKTPDVVVEPEEPAENNGF